MLECVWHLLSAVLTTTLGQLASEVMLTVHLLAEHVWQLAGVAVLTSVPLVGGDGNSLVLVLTSSSLAVCCCSVVLMCSAVCCSAYLLTLKINKKRRC